MGKLPEIKRAPIFYDYDDDYYAALNSRQDINHKNSNSLGDHSFIPTESTVVVQSEVGGPWTHCKVIEHGTQDHNSKSYKICMTKMGCIIMRMMCM